MQVTARRMLHTIVDEGASVSILSSTGWQDLGSPQLVPATNQILAFNRRPTAPLGTLSYFPFTLGGRTICIDVMVVQGPLDFNLLLGRDYVYAMKAVVSTLFRVMHFPHAGKIVTIDHLSFVTPNHRINPSNHKNMRHIQGSLITRINVMVRCNKGKLINVHNIPIIGKMGGMAPASRYHTRFNPLAFM